MKFANLDPAPAGFGCCGRCAYDRTGTAKICFLCAKQTFEELPDERCLICDHPFQEGSRCRNLVCGFPERHFDCCYAISFLSGELHRAILKYKYDSKRGWARIFGRVVAGYLGAARSVFSDYDLIIGSPTFVGGGGRTWDHIHKILKNAHSHLGSVWPIDISKPGVIEKTASTPRLANLGGWKERHDVTRTHLRDALEVPDPARTRGLSIIVFDDVFTAGLTLNEVARALMVQGEAARVTGLVLARAQYRG